jgi:asparagine synthase (glutamine-hydrolysing)
VCGIVGIVARGTRVSPEVLEKATCSLAHRGPDDSGTVILCQNAAEPTEVGLGNRRLAILDLSPLGHQPMHDPVTGNWIVFNGEIYNFRELRDELEKQGLSFTSNSDTEVLLKAYGRWGENCLDRLRGMFAFAIWDAREQQIFLARDPMGIKPLYYHLSEKYFLFASEIRTLLGTGLIPRRLDSAGLLNYLAFGSLYDPNTLIEGIRALLPGHSLTWRNGRITVKKYWDLVAQDGQGGSRDQQSRERVGKNVRDLLLESVHLHMVSDVPVGLFLSGGIDSSSLVGLLTEMGVRPQTFSLVFREASYSESEYSREIAHQYRTEHHEVCVRPGDALDSVPGALKAMDQPTVDGVNTYIISQNVHAAGVKVALSGLGGDEMFGGYSSFRIAPRLERGAKYWSHVPASLRSAWARWMDAFGNSDQDRKVFALVRAPAQILHPCFLLRMLFTPNQVGCLFPGADNDAIQRAKAPFSAMVDDARGLDPINRVSYLETRGYMLNTLLRDSDVMSMAHGLELRVPLVDSRVASHLQSLPGEWKMHSRIPKPLLVGALERKLPNSVVYRPKRGFTLPFEHWLRNELRATIESSLSGRVESSLGSFLDVSVLREVWKDFLGGRTSWSRPWSLYVLNKWCEAHV